MIASSLAHPAPGYACSFSPCERVRMRDTCMIGCIFLCERGMNLEPRYSWQSPQICALYLVQKHRTIDREYGNFLFRNSQGSCSIVFREPPGFLGRINQPGTATISPKPAKGSLIP